MLKKLSKLFILSLISIFFCNCASIIHGNKQEVFFSSQPSGATIYIDEHKIGETPKTIKLPRKGRAKGEPDSKKSYKIKIALDGYLPYELYVKREMDTWFLGNIIFGGLIGIIVDASNGSMYKLTPDQVISQLTKNTDTGMIKQQKGSVYVAVSLDVDPSWQKIGTLEKTK
jgi:PEGA domain